MKPVSEFEQKIGYEFRDKNLLEQALTHSSYANEHGLGKNGNNERLEFLGDAVLELVSSEFLYVNYPELPEGELTKTRASLVCEPSLANVARDVSLGDYLRLSIGEDKTGGRARDSVLSDALEATIGAVFLDGGIDEARSYVSRIVLTDIANKRLFYDSKTTLQEIVQARHNKKLTYRVLKEEGPSHEKIFTVQALLIEPDDDEETADGIVIGEGSGRTKKAAEQAAAYQGVLKFRGKNS